MKFWLIRLGSILLAIGACFLLDFISKTTSSFTQDLIIRAGLFVTLAVSLNLINGITGQFSIGHAAFYMIGAYTTGVLARSYFTSAGLTGPIWLLAMIAAGAFVAAIAGFIVGLPSLRLRGDYLAVVTLGFGEIIGIIAKNQVSLGQAYGMNVEPRFSYTWMVWLLAVICIAVCRNLLKNAHGLAFLSVREDEVAAAAMGVNVTKTKVTAFVIGSAFAGAAGSLFAHFGGFIGPAIFTMDVSFIILTMVVLGGTGSITGSALAAVTLFYIPEAMRELKEVNLSSVVAATIAVIFAVWLMRLIIVRFHGSKGQRAVRHFGAIFGAFVLYFLLALVLSNVSVFDGIIEGSKLRFVVFAATLVILMLLRPQGIFAHHEFSWTWVKSLFTRKRMSGAVPA